MEIMAVYCTSKNDTQDVNYRVWAKRRVPMFTVAIYVLTTELLRVVGEYTAMT
jgi:hypothetical protein